MVVVTNPLNADVSFDSDDLVSALLGEVQWRFNRAAPRDVTPIFSGKDAAVLHREPDGEAVNRLPHVSAVVALYGLEQFPRADV